MIMQVRDFLPSIIAINTDVIINPLCMKLFWRNGDNNVFGLDIILPHGNGWVNSLTPGRCGFNSESLISEHILQIKFIRISCEITLMWMPQNLTNEKVNIGSGNGLMPSGSKPLPEPVLTKIYVAIWPQWVNLNPTNCSLSISWLLMAW